LPGQRLSVNRPRKRRSDNRECRNADRRNGRCLNVDGAEPIILDLELFAFVLDQEFEH
jgi:hypothetical protein